jgi:hypothetical protein
VGIQQLEGHVVAPLVFGKVLRINPILVILALLLGGELAGIVGALVALPILAVVRETVVYLRQHLVLESWGPADAVVLARGPARPPPAPAAPLDEPAEEAVPAEGAPRR